MAAKTGIIQPGSILRPSASADDGSRAKQVGIGQVVAVLGIMIVMAAFIGELFNAGFAARGAETAVAANAAWTFGLGTGGLAVLKVGIALILLGIVRHLWLRVESVKAGLAEMVPDVPDKAAIGSAQITTPYGLATHTEKAPAPLLIHRMAYKMWAPMLVMGVMVTTIGVILSLVQTGAAGETGRYLTLGALTQGTAFFGEALILSGIAFLLGSILGSLRQGGGEIQESLGVGVKTPVMPRMAKAFVALMMMGLMLGMFQFGAYIWVATLTSEAAILANFAWLGPLREISLGLILSGIVLALVTIGTKILPFQFWRIRELIENGR